MDIILIYQKQWDILKPNCMQTQLFCLMFYAENIIFLFIFDTVFYFLQNKYFGRKNTPSPQS